MPGARLVACWSAFAAAVSRSAAPPFPARLSAAAPFGLPTCAIVLDEGILSRTNESSFVETKRKLVGECDLWAIVSLPGGVFSTAGAGVNTNLLFFTKGKKSKESGTMTCRT